MNTAGSSFALGKLKMSSMTSSAGIRVDAFAVSAATESLTRNVDVTCEYGNQLESIFDGKQGFLIAEAVSLGSDRSH